MQKLQPAKIYIYIYGFDYLHIYLCLIDIVLWNHILMEKFENNSSEEIFWEQIQDNLINGIRVEQAVLHYMLLQQNSSVGWW